MTTACKHPFLLTLSDHSCINLRIRTLQESRNGVSREFFHGKRGEIRKKYREGQEEQLGALGLVVNVLVLWSTIYTQAALEYPRGQGETVLCEDIARLSPLGYDNFNYHTVDILFNCHH